MRVTLRYFDGCPNWETAERRVVAALQAAGFRGVEVDREKIDSRQQAEELRFVGSPTILIDGQDPFYGNEARPGLTCRVYRTPEGLQGAPSLSQLSEVFRRLTPP